MTDTKKASTSVAPAPPLDYTRFLTTYAVLARQVIEEKLGEDVAVFDGGDVTIRLVECADCGVFFNHARLSPNWRSFYGRPLCKRCETSHKGE